MLLFGLLIVNSSLAHPFYPNLGDAGFDWMQSGGQAGSTAFSQDVAHLTPHYEEAVLREWDKICVETKSATVNGTVELALYSNDPTTDSPDELLWYSGTLSATSAGVKCATFASGTWTTAGASFRTSSDDLETEFEEVVWRAVASDDGQPSMARLDNTSKRSLGSQVANLTNGELSGFTYTFPGGGGAGVVDFSSLTDLTGLVVELYGQIPKILLVP